MKSLKRVVLRTAVPNYNNGKYMKKMLFLFLSISVLTSCGRECYTSGLEVKTKYQNCTDLSASYVSDVNNEVWTIVCLNSKKDLYVYFVHKDGKFCRIDQNKEKF
jgi:hypothetical protein